jgi:N utilization substance protein B
VARRRAREIAFQALFQSERGALPLLDAWDDVRQALLEHDEESADTPWEAGDLAFAERLVASLGEHKAAIDAELQSLIQGWTFGQMAQTDLNVLRLALAELHLGENPEPVVIEMAVRLAKRFGGEDSGRFVNGVLAKRTRRPAVLGGRLA